MNTLSQALSAEDRADLLRRYYELHELHDMKSSPVVEEMGRILNLLDTPYEEALAQGQRLWEETDRTVAA